MLIQNVEFIKQQMNGFGSRHKPFLFVINYELDEGYFIENPLQQNKIYFQIEGIGNKVIENRCISDNCNLKVYPISQDVYKQKFNIIRDGIYRGDSFLANLTVKTKIETSLSLSDIFHLNKAPFQLFVPSKFVCFSPERFIRIKNNCIYTYPMKGTIDATIPNAEQTLLDDFKETAEHSTIVDLLRNDLSINASSVEVKRFRFIDKIRTLDKEILQVSSEIQGVLDSDYRAHIGDIIFDMLPAGSITGAPKFSTIQLIKQAEAERRGFYTGVFGYFDGQNFDSAVLIRYIEEEGNNLYFRSGGGITAYSDITSEYKEVIDKIYFPFI